MHPSTTLKVDGDRATTFIYLTMCLGRLSSAQKWVPLNASAGESTVDYCSRTAYGSCYW